MEVRANENNCELIAHKQNCTTPEKIKYHCVINELENAFIEVCEPEYRIHGICFHVLIKPNKSNDINIGIDTIFINSLVTHIPINVFYIYLFPRLQLTWVYHCFCD